MSPDCRDVVHDARDGSFDLHLQGLLRSTSTPATAWGGYYVPRAQHAVHVAQAGTHTLTVDRGSQENVCRPGCSGDLVVMSVPGGGR